MASSFMGLYVQREGLNLAQKALDITGNNLTNSKTKGYTRQLLDLTSVQANTGTLGYKDQIFLAGAGVDGLGVTQARDPICDDKYRTYNSIVEKLGKQSDILSYVEDAIDDIENDKTGLAFTLQEFKAAWQAFSSSGTDQTDLANITKSTAQNVIDVLKNFNYRIDTISEDVIDDVKGSANRVNSILRECALLNSEIKSGYVLMENFYQTGYYDGKGMDFQADSNYGPLEVKDKMNMLIDELSGYFDIKAHEESDGTFTISISGRDAVRGDKYSMVTYVQDFEQSDYNKLMNDVKDKIDAGNRSDASDAIDAYFSNGFDRKTPELEALKQALDDASSTAADIDSKLNAAVEAGYNMRYSGKDIKPRELKIELSNKLTDSDWHRSYMQLDQIISQTSSSAPEIDLLYDLRDSLKAGDFNKAQNLERILLDEYPAYRTSPDYKPIFNSRDMTDDISEGKIKANIDLYNGAGVYADTTKNENNTKGLEFYRQTMNALAKAIHDEFNAIYTKNGINDFKIFDFEPDNEGTTYGLKLADVFIDNPIKAVHPEGNYNDSELSNTWVNRILSVFDAKHTVGKETEKYTFEEFVNHYGDVIGTQISGSNQLKDSESAMLHAVSDKRDAVMGVSTGEEGVNMLVYQKWFNAMSRMTTALDQLLDKLINNTGLVGL